MCLCAPCVWLVPVQAEEGIGSPGTGLQTTVGRYVNTGTEPKSSPCSKPWRHLSCPSKCLLFSILVTFLATKTKHRTRGNLGKLSTGSRRGRQRGSRSSSCLWQRVRWLVTLYQQSGSIMQQERETRMLPSRPEYPIHQEGPTSKRFPSFSKQYHQLGPNV